MTRAEAHSRELSLEWIAGQFFLRDGKGLAEALRNGSRWVRAMAISTLEDIAFECARERSDHHRYIAEIVKRERALLAAEAPRTA